MDNIASLVVEAAGLHGLTGVAVAAVGPGMPPTMVCQGVADASGGRSVDPDTVFRVASVTKTMTAIGLMQLQEAGCFGLDDPVNDYLSAFQIQPPPGGPPVTFRHLLTHTAGIGELQRLADVLRPAARGLARPGTPAADLAALYHGTLRPEVSAGTKWAYANHGFAVIGQLVQEISGVPLPDYMREHLFDPLAMGSSDYVRSGRIDGATAAGHQWRGRRLRPVADYDRSLLGAGAVWSTLSDMTRYAQALLQGGAGDHGRILQPGTLVMMWSPQYSPDPRIPGMGLAFFLDRPAGHRVAGHDGNLPGFAAALLLAPDDGLGVVVLTNTATLFGAHLLAGAVLRALLGIPGPASGLPRPDVADQPQHWAQLTGYYAPEPGLLTNFRAWTLLGGEVQVLIRHKPLVVRALSPSAALRRGLRLYPTDPNDPLVFAGAAGGLVVPVAFQPDPDERATTLCVGYPALATLRRRPVWRSSRVRLQAVTAAAAAGLAYRRASHHRHW